jgi:hypothetical protein
MAGEMVFRKDCEDCGRSFFTPDRRTKLCSRCTEAAQKRKQPSRGTEKAAPKAFPAPEGADGIRSPVPPPSDLKARIPIEGETRRDPTEQSRGKGQKEGAGRMKAKGTPAPPAAASAEPEIVLTKQQEQDLIERYRTYVERMERPPRGRRQTIASETGLPYRTVVVTVRKWRLDTPEAKDLTRGERFAVERSYFRLLEERSSFPPIKERISRETGFSLWQVSRCLDLLHEGEDRLREIPDVSPQQKTAILAEYLDYLSAPAPPDPPLHALIAERTGVTPKQVHKVLLAYRLARLR